MKSDIVDELRAVQCRYWSGDNPEHDVIPRAIDEIERLRKLTRPPDSNFIATWWSSEWSPQ